MPDMLCRTKGNSNPHEKARVYFTCHPEDFEKYFDVICDDIFKTHDCAVYYTKDMTAEFDEQDKQSDLGSNNLFVIPVTYKLLSTPNRAMDTDFQYAISEHIPVLPIMVETGIDGLYSRKDKFGELQYLNRESTDATEISYGEKLDKYLDSILISDELFEKIRLAFDAYIFLSYRKKDRRYANELMRLIHSNPECRDIAIWFDEFLTPGESFKDSINRILNDSKLFALLVTPSLLEEPDGKPNFIMTEEYPTAKKAGLDILPGEMVETDKKLLREKFDGIPDCVNVYDNEKFKAQLISYISKMVSGEEKNSPDHTFLIGIAYQEGIDVEVDRQRGLELITQAADEGLPEAMKRLLTMYYEGIGVKADYHIANKWAEKYCEAVFEKYGEKNEDYIDALNSRAVICHLLGETKKALEFSRKVYELYLETVGKDDERTVSALNNLSGICRSCGEYDEAIIYAQKAYDYFCEKDGKTAFETLIALNNLALVYGDKGDYGKALELSEDVYNARRIHQGEKDEYTLRALNNLASAYYMDGDYEKALEKNKENRKMRTEILGADHYDTLITLNNLACCYAAVKSYKKSFEYSKTVYETMRKKYGEEHPLAIIALDNFAGAYRDIKNFKMALKLCDKAYKLHVKVFDEKHPEAISGLNNLAAIYMDCKNPQKALELSEKAYALATEVLGEGHEITLTAHANTGTARLWTGDGQKGIEILNDVYKLRRRLFKKKHPLTILLMTFLAQAYMKEGDSDQACRIANSAYSLGCEMWGKQHINLVDIMDVLSEAYLKMGDIMSGTIFKKMSDDIKKEYNIK